LVSGVESLQQRIRHDSAIAGESDCISGEHPDSINDGWWITEVGANLAANPGAWEDLPASYHNRACGISFADGHSEIHKWVVDSTVQPVKKVNYNGTISALGSQDIMWTIQHVSAPVN